MSQEVVFVHDFHGTINELEIALCIDGEDYGSRDIDIVLNRIRTRIQRQYGIELSGRISDSTSSYVLGDEMRNFIDNMQFIYNKVCALSAYSRYCGEIPISLERVNYIGVSKTSLTSLLKLLQCEGRTKYVEASMDTVKGRITSLPMCSEKKLFLCLVVCYYIGLYELTAVLAEILYLGGLK